MDKKKIVFLGSKDIGFECLKELQKMTKKYNFLIAGVLTNQRGQKIRNFCQKQKIKIISSLDDYLKMDKVDIAISVQYHEILRKKHIDKSELALNFHMAPLPEYRGCNQFSFAILNNDKTFGTTLHRLEEGIDSGDIIFEKRFKIPKNAWVEDLHKLTVEKTLELFKESIPKILQNDFKFLPQAKFKNRKKSFHLRKEIENIKLIDLSKSKKEIERQIRATYMPGFEPPYFIIDCKKFYIVKED